MRRVRGRPSGWPSQSKFRNSSRRPFSRNLEPSSLSRLLAVAVVGFVVQDQNVLRAHELGHHSLQHLAFGLASIERQAPPLKKCPAYLRDLNSFPAPEGVVVGDDNLRPVQSGQQVDRNQHTVAVAAVRVVRFQHLGRPKPEHGLELGRYGFSSGNSPRRRLTVSRGVRSPSARHIAILPSSTCRCHGVEHDPRARSQREFVD